MSDETLRYEPYGRFWAVYENDILLCLVVYRKGAKALLRRLTGGPPLTVRNTAPEPAPLLTSQ